MAPIIFGFRPAVVNYLCRYKEDMTVEQKEALIDLLKFKSHYQITPEIKKELANSVCRGEVSMNEVEML